MVANGLVGLEVEGEGYEEPSIVKAAIEGFFEDDFRRKEANIVELQADLFESTLGEDKGEFLIRSFSEDEIKGAI